MIWYCIHYLGPHPLNDERRGMRESPLNYTGDLTGSLFTRLQVDLFWNYFPWSCMWKLPKSKKAGFYWHVKIRKRLVTTLHQITEIAEVHYSFIKAVLRWHLSASLKEFEKLLCSGPAWWCRCGWMTRVRCKVLYSATLGSYFQGHWLQVHQI